LVVNFHPPAPAQDHVHLLLLHVRVAVRKPIAGRDALVAQGGFLELERLGRGAELQVRSAVEPRADVLQILFDVPERERHGTILRRHSETLAHLTVPCYPSIFLRVPVTLPPRPICSDTSGSIEKGGDVRWRFSSSRALRRSSATSRPHKPSTRVRWACRSRAAAATTSTPTGLRARSTLAYGRSPKP